MADLGDSRRIAFTWSERKIDQSAELYLVKVKLNQRNFYSERWSLVDHLSILSVV